MCRWEEIRGFRTETAPGLVEGEKGEPRRSLQALGAKICGESKGKKQRQRRPSRNTCLRRAGAQKPRALREGTQDENHATDGRYESNGESKFKSKFKGNGKGKGCPRKRRRGVYKPTAKPKIYGKSKKQKQRLPASRWTTRAAQTTRGKGGRYKATGRGHSPINLRRT